MIVVRPVAFGPTGAPTVPPVMDTGGLKSNVTLAGERPVTRADKVHVAPPLRLQPLPDPDDAPNESSVSALSTPCAGSSSRTQNPREKDR